MPNDLIPESMATARGRGDSTIRFACNNGRENGPYDLDDFSIMRAGERIPPIRIAVEGKTIVATFAAPLEVGDVVIL